MDTICSYLEHDHSRCDGLFGQALASVAEQQWEQAERTFRAFEHALQLHLSMEEDVIFTAFEQALGCEPGPTAAMRKEHAQLRGLLYRLANAIAQRRSVDFFDHADTFRIVLQQHSVKEEGILYPMADRVLRRTRSALIDAMVALRSADSAGEINAVAGERHLDVQGLAPAAQMERVLITLGKLAHGQKLCALMDREPYPLYRLLDQNGFSHSTHARSDTLFEVRAWVRDQTAWNA